MKLFWSPRSPYVRKVMILAHEVGIADEIIRESVRVTSSEPSEAVMAWHPLGKIPTLILDNGDVLRDSLVISEHFAAMKPELELSPPAAPARLAMLQRHAFADEIMGEALSLFGEILQPPQAAIERRIALRRRKLRQAFDFLDAGGLGFDASAFDIGHAALGAALGYCDFRLGSENWRAGRPRLARWQAEFSKRPSAIATEPYDETATR